MPDNSQVTGEDALVIANVLNTLGAVLSNAVVRGVSQVKTDPLSPTPFGGSATGAIEAAIKNISTLSFTQQEIDAVQQAMAVATEHENRVQQASGRAVQVINVLKPIVTKLIPLIV